MSVIDPRPHAQYMREVDAQIRGVILGTCRGLGATTNEIRVAVARELDIDMNARSTANMASKMHRCGWLTYWTRRSDGQEVHALTGAGWDVWTLILGRKP